jgi:hypothetical protein
MLKIRFQIVLFLALFLFFLVDPSAEGISLSQQEIQHIGERVFENECASKDENLAQWNEGEDFLSLGIGHFIWYPKGGRGIFKESFPSFLNYVKASGEGIPKWLDKDPSPSCPWNSRKNFLRNQEDPRLFELCEFLMATKPLQAVFIVKRLDEALALMLKSASEESREKITIQFRRVASTPLGIYALIDYVNFKGLGTVSFEKYHGKAWGLFQVLSEMRDEAEAPSALEEFVRAADTAFTERVNNAPKRRNEQKWLPGWQKRINSYLKQQEIIS